MGTGRSSSKRKKSSSLKKRRSKNSSEVRRRKKIRSKSGKNKAKKVRRRSISSFGDDDDSRSSRSVAPVSCSSFSSSSEDDYRRRSRSRTRRDEKGSRKRAQKISSRRGMSQDSLRARKSKGSKRNVELDIRKKTQKKKPRRDVSISSISSGSRSCSTCRGYSSSDESEFERERRRSERKGRDKRIVGKAKNETERSRYRLRSCSSCSKYSNSSGYQSEERPIIENNSRRLRSVITFVKEPEDEQVGELNTDENKEEMIYDHDDYPCRSGDSNDGGSKRELAYHSNVSEKRRWVENVEGEETFEVAKGRKEGGDQHKGSYAHHDGVGANNFSKETNNEISAAMSSPKDDDLESILRQKALENLRKFRGGLQTNVKTPAELKHKNVSVVKQLSTTKAELVQSEHPIKDDVRFVGTTQVADQVSMPKTDAYSTCSSQNESRILEVKRGVIKSVVARKNNVSPSDQVAAPAIPREKMNTTAGANTVNPQLSKSALKQEFSSAHSSLNPVATSHTCTENLLQNNIVETAKAMPQGSNNRGMEVHNPAVPQPSSFKTASGDSVINKMQDENKEGSQFEQKTMSVMRGGEMVQVSYKVYIPKKTPALARRQLLR